MPNIDDQSILRVLVYLPFVASMAILLYCLVVGKIPVRGRAISRQVQPGLYWSVLVMLIAIIVMPSLYLAVTQ